jgi:formylglycine-generating enzyme required for sulfatase activity
MSAPATTLYPGRIFPGLRPFEAEDAVLFFGREEQTDELLRRLGDTRFLGVVGLSGSGKSSLVRAGLLPALRRGHLEGASSQWRVAVTRPGSDPLGIVARELNLTLGPREDRLGFLRSGKLGLADASRHGRNPDENLLLVVDQFEEIFRFRSSNRDRAGEAAEFVELLIGAAQEYESEYRVYIVITMNSDFLGECAQFSGLPEILNESQYLLPRMARAQLREAILGPAALGGVQVTEDLLKNLLDRTEEGRDQLPVLQHLLLRMWETRQPSGRGFRLTNDQYEAVGGWDDALNRHAEAVARSLPEQSQSLVKRIFQRLTERGLKGQEVRRPATVRELKQVAEVSSGEVATVVERFREEGCNLLTSPDRDLSDDSVIDISHECLIRHWKLLCKWTEEEADWGEWYRRVEDRRRIKGALLVDPELEAALLARKHGRWNPVWAERYAIEKNGVKPAYGDVIRFLNDSEEKRRVEIAQLRQTKKRVAAAAVLFAVLFVAAAVAGWLAWRANIRADEATAKFAALLSSPPSPVKRGPEIEGAAGKFVLIRAGTFLMGCSLGDIECNSGEKPTHKVTLTHDFYMGESDVTVGAYRRFVQATRRAMPEAPPFTQTDVHPVVNVSWQDATDYCKWDGGGRLPTEAQWEYASRAGTNLSRYGNLDEIAWYANNSGIINPLNSDRGAHPVKQKEPNNFGLYDMLGNVWQWCADWYDGKYYEKSPPQDPPGPESSPDGTRSLRGGSWIYDARSLRVSYRARYRPGVRYGDVGFRCVRDVP